MDVFATHELWTEYITPHKGNLLDRRFPPSPGFHFPVGRRRGGGVFLGESVARIAKPLCDSSA